MTEAEWLSCSSPEPMLAFLRNCGARDRKLRLFACACGRRAWGPVAKRPGEWPESILLAERFADGAANQTELADARENSWGVGEYSAFSCAYYATEAVLGENPMNSARVAADHATDSFVLRDLEERPQPRPDRNRIVELRQVEAHALAGLLRDILGPLPFRPISFCLSWQTPTVMALATRMYDSRDFSLMPIQADALADAGCSDEQLLEHLREPGPHVRGCWALDLILGKE